MRRHFLVKPKIQLLHLALILGALTLSILVGYIFVESTLASHLVDKLTAAEWMQLRNDLRWGFCVVFLILLCAVGIEHFLFFHSIVGPLFAMENSVKRMLKGEYGDPVHVRDTDQLQDLVQSFEELRKKIKAEAETKKP